jgi:DNA-nicking Smr family endonuclease
LKQRPRTVFRGIREVPVEQELDLHGLTIDQGLLELENFIRLCGRFGVGCVRVIHGLGPDRGRSMRKAVRTFLSSARARPWLEKIEVEPHNPGSVILHLAGTRR